MASIREMTISYQVAGGSSSSAQRRQGGLLLRSVVGGELTDLEYLGVEGVEVDVGMGVGSTSNGGGGGLFGKVARSKLRHVVLKNLYLYSTKVYQQIVGMGTQTLRKDYN